MTLEKLFKKDFGLSTRNKGDSYLRRGYVTVKSHSDELLHARVKGSYEQYYDVNLDWSEPYQGLIATCKCPHYDDGNFCKHLWATMLVADQQGLVPTDLGRTFLVHSDDEDEFGADDFGDYDDYDIPPRNAMNGTRPLPSNRGKQPTAKTPAWHALLARPTLRQQEPKKKPIFGNARTKVKRVQFIIDVAASLHAGALTINLYQQQQLKDGQWGQRKSLKVYRHQLDDFSPGDQRRLELAFGNYTGVPWSHDSRVSLRSLSYQQVSRVEVVPAVHDLLLPELCAEECLGWVLSSDQPVEDCRRLVWEAGPSWQFRLSIADDAKSKTWTVRGELVRGEQVLPLSEAVLLLASGLVVFPDSLANLASPADFRWISLLRSVDQVCVPYADRQKLLAELWAAGQGLGAVLPANLQLHVETVPPRGCLTIHPPDNQASNTRVGEQSLLYADVHFDYADQRVAPHDPQSVLLEGDSDRLLIRDEIAEGNLLAELIDLKVKSRQPNYYSRELGDVQFQQQHFGNIVDQLSQKGWQVLAEGVALKRAGEFRATVVSGVDWFDLETQIDFDGNHVSLPRLLSALRNNERCVLLDDGSQGLLPQEWLERYAPLAEFAQIEGDRLRFRPSQVFLLDALLDEKSADLQIQVDRQFGKLRDKLRSPKAIKPREAPTGFHGKLRPYQKEGLGWISFLEEIGLNGCLADDMGLGKTVQVLAWLVARTRRRSGRPHLIVAPKSVVFNWQLEAERFAPKLKVLNYTGLDRAARFEQFSEVDLVLTTYGTLRKDIELLKDVAFDYVILDEAQAIKNDKSISAKACRLLQAEHRLVLTGTPVENHLGDLWSLFEFLNPGMLGRCMALQSYARSNGEDQTALDTLRRGLQPFILRRTKEQVLKDLPKKNEQTLLIDLLPVDRKRYNELRDHYRRSLLSRVDESGMNAARMHVLEALLRLRQTACHAGLVDKKLIGKSSAKLEAVLEQATEVVAEGHKALIFSQFTSLLSIVRTSLDDAGLTYEYLDGRTRNRQERVERFQNDPACSLFLISLKAGGTGLNLTAADYVFLLDPWWNPAVEAQAIDRVHRIGQQRPVFAYRLVARDTVEEKILELQYKKRELADTIISGDKSLLAGLSFEDLQLLLT